MINTNAPEHQWPALDGLGLLEVPRDVHAGGQGAAGQRGRWTDLVQHLERGALYKKKRCYIYIYGICFSSKDDDEALI